MFVGRVANRELRLHPAWLLGPLGLLACIAVGVAQGYGQSAYVPLAVVGGLGAVGWLALVVFRPEWALLAYAFAAVNLNGVDLPTPVGGLRLSPDILLTSVLMVGMVLRLLLTRQWLSRLPITFPYLVFLAVPFITLAASPVPLQSVKGAFRFVGYYALMWLIVDVVRTPQQAMRLVAAVMLSPVIPVLVGFYQLATGGGQVIRAGESFNRVYGLAGGPFTLAFYLVLVIPLLLVFLLERDLGEEDSADGPRPIYRRRRLLVLLLAGSLLGLLFTFIRGAWLSLSLVVVLLGLVRYRRLLFLFPVSVAGLLWLYSPAQARLAETLSPTSTWFGRLRLWNFALEWIATSPLVGVGMKAFEYYYVLLAAPITGTGIPRRVRFLVGQRPHNEILGFLLDVGIIGTVALVAVLFIVVRLAVRVYRQAPQPALRLFALGFLMSATGMFVGAMGDNVFSQPSAAVYFWIMAGLIMAIERHMMAPAA